MSFSKLDFFLKLIYAYIGVKTVIERTEYLEELKRWKDKDLIKVVTAMKRCGKSTLFELFINYLKENNINEERIIKINVVDWLLNEK